MLSITNHLIKDENKTIIFNKLKNEDAGNKIYLKINDESSILHQMLQQLYEMKIQSILVEGGAQLLQSFIDEGCWDEARIIINEQLIIENGVPSPELKNHSLVKTENLFSDTIYYYSNSIKS